MNVFMSSCKVSIIVVRFQNKQYSRPINKYSTQNITEILPARAGFFDKSRRTDVTKPVVTFRNFANWLMSVAYTYFPGTLASDIRRWYLLFQGRKLIKLL